LCPSRPDKSSHKHIPARSIPTCFRSCFSTLHTSRTTRPIRVSDSWISYAEVQILITQSPNKRRVAVSE
jgi:hypothetical protein